MRKRPNINVARHVIGTFDYVFESVMTHSHNEYWLDGGRGSTKSSFISICIVVLMVAFPEVNAVVVRRFQNTLRDSVYNQVLWAISELGVTDWFKASVSPMEITYKPTGQKIVFRGMDDPLKLKGIKFTVGYGAIQWFEELDQFTGWDAISSALKSFRRGGDRFWTFYSYNPPKTMWCWVNRQMLEMERKPTCLVNHSSYLDVIDSGHADWLGEPFIEDAEWLKATNEQQYRWEMLGEITGTGGSVFDNIVQRRIPDEEIRSFDNPRNGVDWGWFPDPWRFIRCEWQRGERRLIVFEEHSRNRMLPRDTGQIIVDALTYPDSPGGAPRYHAEEIWYDDTPDGKVQGTVYRKDYGLRARPAQKGGMRDVSYQWLAGLREIVIDPDRCPLTLEEFLLKEYDRDPKTDEWIASIPDGNDHSIDAVRYAMMRDIRRAG